jgi:hypothetical protein
MLYYRHSPLIGRWGYGNCFVPLSFKVQVRIASQHGDVMDINLKIQKNAGDRKKELEKTLGWLVPSEKILY